MTEHEMQASVPIVLVRLRHDIPGIRQSQRAVHVVPADATNEPDSPWKTWCGTSIAPSDAEVLDGITGMPCERCMAQAPTPEMVRLRELMLGEGVMLPPR